MHKGKHEFQKNKGALNCRQLEQRQISTAHVSCRCASRLLLGAHRTALAIVWCRHDFLLFAHCRETPHVRANIALICTKLPSGPHDLGLDLDVGIDTVRAAMAIILRRREPGWALQLSTSDILTRVGDAINGFHLNQHLRVHVLIHTDHCIASQKLFWQGRLSRALTGPTDVCSDSQMHQGKD